MYPKTKYHFIAILVLSSVFSGCTPGHTTAPASPVPATVAPTQVKPPTATRVPTRLPTLIPTPISTLNKGDFYFSIDGKQSFLFSRNVAGNETSHYDQLLDWTSTGGSKFVRIHLDSFGMGYSKTGKVDEAWATKWEIVFDKAASNGTGIIPVFGVWYDWKTAELFISDSPTQELWLQWMKTLVERWQGRENILAWEIFSEVNMVPGVTESEGIDFVNRAASIIRASDSHHRPVTASLAENSGWSSFYHSDAIDFTNIHPYPISGELDREIITEARSRLAEYHKPVMIGEAGLSFRLPDSYPSTLTTADRADIGIRHAIWAGVVSGAMNGRSLWWEDGVAIYFPSVSWPFLNKYSDIELPAAKFVSGVDVTGFQPLTSRSSSGVWGAAVGNEKVVLGWYRDATSEPPDWKVRRILSKQTVTLTVPGLATNWGIDFYNTRTGTDIVSSTIVTRKGNKVTIPLPDFTDDIAFKMYVQK